MEHLRTPLVCLLRLFEIRSTAASIFMGSSVDFSSRIRGLMSAPTTPSIPAFCEGRFSWPGG